jgi:hypothetical protein
VVANAEALESLENSDRYFDMISGSGMGNGKLDLLTTAGLSRGVRHLQNGRVLIGTATQSGPEA